MEVINNIWTTIAPYITGTALTGILSTIIYGCLKGAFSKAVSKINVEKISEQATEKGLEKIKKVSFKHSIQPLCESELKKITEQANIYIEKSLEDVQKQYDALINVLEKLANYFDNSIGVPETAKAELHKAIETAKTPINSTESVVVEEDVKEEPKQAIEPKETAKKPTKVER